MNKILYPSRIIKGNLGDVLINVLLIRELLNHSEVYLKGKPRAEVYDLIVQNNPDKNKLNIIDSNSKSLFLEKLKIFSNIAFKNKYRIVFDTPGHVTEKKKHLKTLLKAISDIVKADIYHLLNIKIYKFGITLGPFKNDSWFLYKKVCKKTDHVMLRDKRNYEQLKTRKLKNIHLGPDLAFLLYRHPQLNPIPETKIEKEGVVISLRGSLIGKKIEHNYFDTVVSNTISLVSQIVSEAQINVVKLSYQVDCDREPAMVLFDKLKIVFPSIELIFIDHILNFDQASELYRNSKFVITNRLHVFLFAMILNTKSYVVTDIVKHQKLIAIINDLELSSLVYSPELRYSFQDPSQMELFAKHADINARTLRESIKTIATL
ncbi:polysaccharide pyruvyl transferase family protein [Mangrovibacterium diazotrophicum]|uniref:Polysaccharide pyruvyl transferase WcaK-like protein n=1 Tax=Mangrovibacterium diazotrophicum TaxID=1261403 RepID=A0A419W954_9BACT|nr:polysaccharide pyruvyl transferase family protein [Mangrovibacterium diazotrophicum]RKD92001.1 polysaccharide pyruvyl transferase WcaK-like protein [Mangrovibacterium diazotrophicum]